MWCEHSRVVNPILLRYPTKHGFDISTHYFMSDELL